MHSIHRFRTSILIAIFIAIASVSSFAQSSKSYNFRDHQNKPYYFGITLGYNTSSYKLFHSDKFIRNDSIFSTNVKRSPGLDLKIVTNLKIGQYIDIRLLPGLAFAGRSIQYTYEGEKSSNRKINSVFAELPVQVRYKSEPWKDIRMFVLGGVKYSYDVASESRAQQAEELVKFSPSDYQLEVGAGMQFFFPYFIFSPEIKFSHGLGNVLIYDSRLEQSLVLDKVLSRAFTISLHFEG